MCYVCTFCPCLTLNPHLSPDSLFSHTRGHHGHTPILRTSVSSALRVQHGADGVLQTNGGKNRDLTRFSPPHTQPHFPRPHTLPVTQCPQQPTSALCSPSEQLCHQDDEDQEEKSPQDEAEDLGKGKNARDRIGAWSGPYGEQDKRGWTRSWAQGNSLLAFPQSSGQ